MLVAAIGTFVAAVPLFLGQALGLYTESQRLMAWTLFVMSTVPFFFAATRKTRRVPLMLLLSAQYAVLYALPVFFEDFMTTLRGPTVPSSGAVDTTLFCAILSLLSIGIGYAFAGRVFRFRFELFHFKPSSIRLFWFAVLTLAGSASLQLGQGSLFSWVPGPLAQPLHVILSADLGIAILACLFYQNSLARWQKLTAISLLLVSILIGLAGGMFQNVVQPILVWVICRWIIRGKAPVVSLVVLAAAFFLVQPVKGSYRHLVLLSGRSFTATEKLGVYGRLLKEQWLDARGLPSDILEMNRQSARKRLSLLLTTAHYVELTPIPIAYKNGATLEFLAYGWIPRAVWPGKPIAQEANKILPVEYGIQDIRTQNVTMFGVGHLTEAYVNFGTLGIIPVFLLLGILYRVPQALLERRRNTATIAIFVSVTLAMVPIGSSIGHAFGGFIQQILVQGFLLRLFTTERVRLGRSSWASAGVAAGRRGPALPLIRPGTSEQPPGSVRRLS